MSHPPGDECFMTLTRHVTCYGARDTCHATAEHSFIGYMIKLAPIIISFQPVKVKCWQTFGEMSELNWSLLKFVDTYIDSNAGGCGVTWSFLISKSYYQF